MLLDFQFKDVRETRTSQNLNSIELDFIGLKTCQDFSLSPNPSFFSFFMDFVGFGVSKGLGLRLDNFFLRKSFEKIPTYELDQIIFYKHSFLLIFFRNQEERLLRVSKNFEPNNFKSNCQIIN